MPRQRKQPQTQVKETAPTPAPSPSEAKLIPQDPPGQELILDGDYAGMTYDEVMEIHRNAVHDVLGEMTIEGALATIDNVVGDALAIMLDAEGSHKAKLAGLRICATALPYAMIDLSQEPDRPKTLAELRKIGGK